MSGVLSMLNAENPAGMATCAPVTFSPPSLSTPTPLTSTLTTVQAGGHIFYTKSTVGPITPTHAGDVATGSTIRAGTSSISVSTGTPTTYFMAVVYQSGYLDSDITEAEYDSGA